MRRLLMVGLGLVSWIAGGMVWGQSLIWDQMARYFQFQGEIRLSIDKKSLESFENWETPELPLLPIEWRESLLRPYFEKTHPGQKSDADWQVSAFFNADWYAYSHQQLPQGGHALVMLNEDKSGPYLLLLTYNPLGKFEDALLLYADFQAQGTSESCRSNWADSTTIMVARTSSWEVFDDKNAQPRRETLMRAYHLDGKGKLKEEPLGLPTANDR